jgi:signal transduction histidine kinase/ligand-binding sensor domain-containing protein
MWFGTEDGLNRYDGYNFMIYRHEPGNANSLSNSHIRAILEDDADSLWIGTYGGGLNQLELETGLFTHYREDPSNVNSLNDDQILSLIQDREGILWIGTRSGGLNRFDPETGQFTHYQYDPADPYSLSNDAVWAVFEDSRGMLWVGTERGLNKFDREAGRFRHYLADPYDRDSLRGNAVQTILEDHTGVLWVGTATGGLNRFDRDTETFTHYHYDATDLTSLCGGSAKVIFEDLDGVLWIGTDGGLCRFERELGQFTRYRHDPLNPDSLGSDQVYAIYQDRSEGLWIGTYGAGISRYDRRQEQFGLYKADPFNPSGLTENAIWAIHEDHTGLLWIGTDGGGLNCLDRETGHWRNFQNELTNPHSLSSNTVMVILEDHQGELWVGTDGGGLERFVREVEQFAHYRSDPGDLGSLSNNTIWAIYEDREDTLWVGTEYGLNRLDRKTGRFTRYLHDPDDPNSLSDNNIGSIYMDQSGMLWVGTHSGLNRLDPATGKFTRFYNDPDNPASLSHDIVFSIYEDHLGALWFGTWGGGLNKFDPASEVFTHYRIQDGLPNDVIYGILADDEGNLWLSTNNGVSRFDPRTETFRNYDAADGLQGTEFNYNAYFKNSDGEIFFGGLNGFNAFYPTQIQDNPYVPPIVLTALTQEGEPVSLDKAVDRVAEVSFRWPNNYFEFEFAALSYFRSDKNQYAYWLEGFDNDWSYIGAKRFGRYTNLPGGTYTLHLKGANNDGVWNEAGISIQITIIPPFWDTWWFRGVVVLVLVGSVIAGYRLRVQSVEDRSRELERLVEQRTFEIERGRRELEALYRADEELYRYLHLDQVLQALVDTAVELLQADKGALMVLNEQREQLVVRASHGFHPDTLARISFAMGEGIAGEVAATGEPIIVEDACTDPRATLEIIEPEGICSFMQVPIKTSGEIFGVFSADYVEPHTFQDAEQRLLLSLAQRAAMAIENAQRYERAQEVVVVEERQRLARELHDSVTQALYGMTLYAEAMSRQLPSGNTELLSVYIQELQETAREALREMRLLIFELRPPLLEEEGLVAALQSRLEAVEQRAGMEAYLELATGRSSLGMGRMPANIEDGLYRIAQEALNNALKHAYARKVTVSLRQEQRTVIMEIADDGIGFELDSVQEHAGLGLPGMKERAAQMGGSVVVSSRSGEGTIVHVEIPVPDRPGIAVVQETD